MTSATRVNRYAEHIWCDLTRHVGSVIRRGPPVGDRTGDWSLRKRQLTQTTGTTLIPTPAADVALCFADLTTISEATTTVAGAYRVRSAPA